MLTNDCTLLKLRIMKSFYELGYRDIDEAYAENRDTNPHHFHYYDSGMITYKKKYIHLYKRK